MARHREILCPHEIDNKESGPLTIATLLKIGHRFLPHVLQVDNLFVAATVFGEDWAASFRHVHSR